MPNLLRTVAARWRAVSVVAWIAVWVFWLVATRSFHPTTGLVLLVTTALVVAYATAVYLNHLLLLPRLWQPGYRARYVVVLAVAMAVLTAMALLVIRSAYLAALGPDPDPYGALRHYGIDLLGMAVHVLAAAVVVWIVGRLMRTPRRARPDEALHEARREASPDR